MGVIGDCLNLVIYEHEHREEVKPKGPYYGLGAFRAILKAKLHEMVQVAKKLETHLNQEDLRLLKSYLPTAEDLRPYFEERMVG